MSKKIKYIVAAVLAAVVCAAVIFTINRKKSGINMNVGELSGDEQNYWNPDIHSISKAENGYYYLHYDGKNPEPCQGTGGCRPLGKIRP